MASTDRRVREDKPVTPAFILAALLWPVAMKESEHLQHRGDPPMVAMHSAAQQVIGRACQVLSIPKRFSIPLREIWEFQLRLERRQGKRAAELVDHRRFRAAYDFLLLREEAGEETGDIGEWWTHFQTLEFEERLAEVRASGGEDRNEGGGRRRGGRGRGRPRTRRGNSRQ